MQDHAQAACGYRSSELHPNSRATPHAGCWFVLATYRNRVRPTLLSAIFSDCST